MKRIKFLYPRKIKPVTGGQRYEQSLRDSLTMSGLEVETLSNISTDSGLTKLQKLFSPLLALRFVTRFKKNKDFVVLNSTTGLYFIMLSSILKLLKVPTAIIHHHYLYKEFSGFKKYFYHRVENLFLKSASYIITPSPYIKDMINKEISIDPILLPIPFKRPVPDIKNNTNIGQLLYIGTIEERKGLDLLIESLHLLDSSHSYILNIVGKTRSPKYKKYLENLIKRYNIKVIFHGFLSDEELNEIIGTSDVFVFPSLLEGFGMAINEVKFFGLPVVCFNNSAMPYSTTDGEDGFVVKNKDTREFSNAIEKIVGDRNLREEMSRKAMLKAGNLYSFQSFSKDSVKLFSNLIN